MADDIPAPLNGEDGRWFCPAFGKVIDDGFCWECAFAGQGGPLDTAQWLRHWLARLERFHSLDDFHRVCHDCPHCPWRRAPEGG